MKLTLINVTKLLLIAVVAGSLFSCVKPLKEGTSTRQTLVKILGAGTPFEVVKSAIAFENVPVQLLAVDLRRDANDEGELFTTMNVVVRDDNAAVTAADPSYVVFPEAWYTIQSEVPKVGGSGGTFTFTFKPGEFAKQIYITIPNATLLDPSTLYALGFTIESVDAGGKISNSKTVVLEIGAKNIYDGVYEITGTCVDAQGLYTGDYGDPVYPRQYELVTAGASSGLFYDISWDYPNYVVLSIATGGGANTGIRPFITFDPATNNIVSIVNFNNGTPLTVAPGSKFNAGDRSIDLGWVLGRWTVNEHWTFLRER